MRRYFIAGLLVWLPIWGTYVIIRFVVNLLDQSLLLLPTKYQPEQLLGTHIPGIGFVFSILLLLLTGVIATNYLGKHLVALWDKCLARIPLIRSIYSAVKQVVHAFLKPKTESFSQVLLVEYPRKGVWSFAFQTGKDFQGAPHDQPTKTVFIPTTPNPTSGFLLIVPKTDVIALDMNVEDALKMIVSLGVIMPEKMKGETNSPSTPPQP